MEEVLTPKERTGSDSLGAAAASLDATMVYPSLQGVQWINMTALLADFPMSPLSCKEARP